MKVINKIGLVMIQNWKILIVRKRGASLFLMPGGQPETGETEIETLAREITEETTASLSAKDLRFFGEFEDTAANDPGAVVRMKVYVGSVDGKIVASSEIAEYRWFDPHKDDWNILSAIIKNYIVPALLKKGLI